MEAKEKQQKNEPEKKYTRCPFKEAIYRFINLLNSQMDSYPILIKTLAANVKTNQDTFEKFLKDKNVRITDKNDEKNTYAIPLKNLKDFERLLEAVTKSINAFNLIPQNIVVAMVSLYDAYLTDIINCAYTIKPDLLNASERNFSFSEIIKFGSIEQLKKSVIEKDVESIMRESHLTQFKKLSTKFDLKLEDPSFDDFLEITERRNLFVHTNGKVSSQYLSQCKGIRPIDHKEKDVQIGEILSVSPMYIEHCYQIIFQIGVKLGHVVWSKLENDLEKTDESLIEIGYDLIKSRKYALACIITDFSCSKGIKHFNKENEYMLCINNALSYYLNGDKVKCKEILQKQDWSGTETKFQLANKVLLEEENEAISLMKECGTNKKMQNAYSEWPLFTNFRKKTSFQETYKEIYGEDYKYEETKLTKWEDVIQNATRMIKESKKSRKSKKDSSTDE